MEGCTHPDRSFEILKQPTRVIGGKPTWPFIAILVYQCPCLVSSNQYSNLVMKLEITSINGRAAEQAIDSDCSYVDVDQDETTWGSLTGEAKSGPWKRGWLFVFDMGHHGPFDGGLLGITTCTSGPAFNESAIGKKFGLRFVLERYNEPRGPEVTPERLMTEDIDEIEVCAPERYGSAMAKYQQDMAWTSHQAFRDTQLVITSVPHHVSYENPQGWNYVFHGMRGARVDDRPTHPNTPIMRGVPITWTEDMASLLHENI